MEKVKVETNWDLKKWYFESYQDPKIDKIIEATKNGVDAFIQKYKGRIANLSPDEFKTYLNESNILFEPLTKVYRYFSYLTTLETQNQDWLKRQNEIYSLWSELSEKFLFINEELKTIGYDGFMKLSQELPDHKNYFIQQAENLKYILSEDVEKGLIQTGQVISIFNDMYDEYTNSFMYQFGDKLVTRGEVGAKRSSPKEEERKEATDSINNKFGLPETQIVLGNIYKSVCKANKANIKLRGYDGIMYTRNKSEELDTETVNKLLDTVRSNFPIFQKFLKLKAKFLNKPVLDYWDILAPIPNNNDSNISFSNGLQFYLDNIKEFDLNLYKYSVDLFNTGRVDVYPKKGKRSGAYASYDKNMESMVMLNYNDDFDSIMTLAHEVGHAYHGYLSQSQPHELYHSPLCLAETASIFNETLIFENMLKTIKDNKAYYIVEKLNDIFSTTFRQVMYVLFEKECHERILNGEELGYTDFNDIWFKYLQELYGDSVKLGDNMKYGWSSIPHIFNTPFYCYAYSFGNILSLNLYQQYKTKPEGFINIYESILKSGGSEKPYDLLIKYGIDINSETFYNNAIKEIENLISNLE